MFASELLDRITRDLNDINHVRWSEATLLDYLTAAQRMIVSLRPMANAVTLSDHLLEGGNTLQHIPAGYYTLIDVVRNMGQDGFTPGLPITVVERDTLDDANSNWHTETGSTVIDNYTYDERNPTSFYITPPASTETDVFVEIVVSKAPARVGAVTENVEIDDVFEEAIREYMMYLALSQNSDSAYDREKAKAHLQTFYLSLGEDLKARILTSPNEQEATNG